MSEPSSFPRNFEAHLRALRDEAGHLFPLAEKVWAEGGRYLAWPPAVDAGTGPLIRFTRREWAESKPCRYPDEVAARIKREVGRADTRSNGPAVMAFRLAGGRFESWMTKANGHHWSIHHIYDGTHPVPGWDALNHCLGVPGTMISAVERREFFAHPAGLVAIHPIADKVAEEVGWFAWQLRYRAWRVHGFDPAGVFGAWKTPRA